MHADGGRGAEYGVGDWLGAVERGDDGRTNPMGNAGAIATSSLAPGGSLEQRWQFLQRGLSLFAGRPLTIDDEVYASASATNARNQGIARLLQSYGRLYCEPSEAVDLYTRQCSLQVSAKGNSVKGQKVARFLSARLGLDVLTSRPAS